MSLNVQGSNLFFLDPDSSDGTITEVGCVTTLDGLTASREQNDVTCISDETRRLEAGLLTPGAANFGILFDTEDESHVRLHELYRLGTTLKWALGMSDGTTAPTLLTSDGDIAPTADRSWLTFEGYISDFPWSFQVGQKVTNQLALQVADFPVLTVKTA
jgi:hypothetical protein